MKLYLAELPDIFGYGLCVVDNDKDKAMNALADEFHRVAPAWGYTEPFSRAMDYFGGGVREITPGKVYNDGFRE